jgi:hypothetical protein
MTVEEIKASIKDLSVADRRKVALYILELEKDRLKDTVGPQISEDIDSVSKLVQGAIDKLKNVIKDGR